MDMHVITLAGNLINTINYRKKRGINCDELKVAQNATQNTTFVARVGFSDLVWLKLTFSTLFHISFGTALSVYNRSSSCEIKTVDTPLDIQVNIHLIILDYFRCACRNWNWGIL